MPSAGVRLLEKPRCALLDPPSATSELPPKPAARTNTERSLSLSLDSEGNKGTSFGLVPVAVAVAFRLAAPVAAAVTGAVAVCLLPAGTFPAAPAVAPATATPPARFVGRLVWEILLDPAIDDGGDLGDLAVPVDLPAGGRGPNRMRRN